MTNLKIKHTKLNDAKTELMFTTKEIESNVLSFYFKDGENFHFELQKNATKKDLLSGLLKIAELIKKSIMSQKEKLNDEH